MTLLFWLDDPWRPKFLQKFENDLMEFVAHMNKAHSMAAINREIFAWRGD